MKEEGDRFESERQLPNGEWMTVKMEVNYVEKTDDIRKVHASMTEESREKFEERLEEIGRPSQ